MPVSGIFTIIAIAIATFDLASSDSSCAADVTSLLQTRMTLSEVQESDHRPEDLDKALKDPAMSGTIKTIVQGLAQERLEKEKEENKQKTWISHMCKLSLFPCPKRLATMDEDIADINDRRFHLLHDDARNEFLWKALEPVVQDKKVLVLGSGGGLMELMAAKLGAKKVDGLQPSAGMREVELLNVHNNGFESIVNIYDKTHHFPSGSYDGEDDKADVLVPEHLSEFATLGDVEAWDNFCDAKKLMLKKGGVIVPAGVALYAQLLQSDTMWESRSIKNWHGINLESMNSFLDTKTVQWANSDKLRFPLQGPGSPPATEMSDRIELLSLDYYAQDCKRKLTNRSVHFKATKSGPVHGIVISGSAFSDPQRTLAFDMDDYSLRRRAAFQLQVQLVAEETNPDSPDGLPQELHVKEGEEFILDFTQFGGGYKTPGFHFRRASEQVQAGKPATILLTMQAEDK